MIRKKGNPGKTSEKHGEANLTPERIREKYRRRRRFVRFGQVIMLAGLLIAFQHWLAHLGVFGAQPPLWLDVVAGYPAGALILVIGAIVAGRKAT